MQRPILLLVFAIYVIMANAKDLVVLRSGDIIEAIVTEIKKDEVSYKKASNPNDPTYTIDNYRLLILKYILKVTWISLILCLVPQEDMKTGGCMEMFPLMIMEHIKYV